MSQPSILLAYPATAGTCRCGTRYPTERAVYSIVSVPDSQEELFRNQLFCSITCLRSFCFEVLRTLEMLDTPAARATVVDLHEFYQGLAKTLTTLLGPQS